MRLPALLPMTLGFDTEEGNPFIRPPTIAKLAEHATAAVFSGANGEAEIAQRVTRAELE